MELHAKRVALRTQENSGGSAAGHAADRTQRDTSVAGTRRATATSHTPDNFYTVTCFTDCAATARIDKVYLNRQERRRDQPQPRCLSAALTTGRTPIQRGGSRGGLEGPDTCGWTRFGERLQAERLTPPLRRGNPALL
ncbi:hypothetical protein FQA47_024508 [Oryzias melastigma]|uniref:Uncharacterized protein n=1 Tax=Oryzias melastigma TaxID=30732 RepID=A0A834EYN9_ORYME|nr:hypothetical protein FQA47_024508 [Oryzias melastigma]